MPYSITEKFKKLEPSDNFEIDLDWHLLYGYKYILDLKPELNYLSFIREDG